MLIPSDHGLSLLKQGTGSSVEIEDTTSDIRSQISIVCGQNCKVRIQGIQVANAKILIYMNDNSTLIMGGGRCSMALSIF
jgi:hypothetical protein